MISVILPAFNEQRTIAHVIATAKALPTVSEVIVVSDGSTDRTAQVARLAGATVVELERNVGKAGAMQAGVSLASEDILMFLDADLTGLTVDMLRKLSEPVLSGQQDMTVVARDYWVDYVQYLLPSLAIGGERVLRRAVWELVPAHERKGFEIELALNHYVRSNGLRYSVVRAKGLGHTYKRHKQGWWKGNIADAWMFLTCVRVFVRYSILSLRSS